MIFIGYGYVNKNIVIYLFLFFIRYLIIFVYFWEVVIIKGVKQFFELQNKFLLYFVVLGEVFVFKRVFIWFNFLDCDVFMSCLFCLIFINISFLFFFLKIGFILESCKDQLLICDLICWVGKKMYMIYIIIYLRN